MVSFDPKLRDQFEETQKNQYFEILFCEEGGGGKETSWEFS